MTKESGEFKVRRFVVTGRTKARESKPGGKKGAYKPAVVLRRVGDDGTLGKRDEVYLSKNLQRAVVGGVYEMEASEDTIHPSTFTYKERWHDEAAVAEWQATSRAAEIVEAAERRERNDSEPIALELLRPLRRAYSRTNWNGKMALEVLVLNYLRMGAAKFAEEDDREAVSYTVESAVRKHFDVALDEFLGELTTSQTPDTMTPRDWWITFLNQRMELPKGQR